MRTKCVPDASVKAMDYRDEQSFCPSEMHMEQSFLLKDVYTRVPEDMEV